MIKFKKGTQKKFKELYGESLPEIVSEIIDMYADENYQLMPRKECVPLLEEI